MAARDVYLRVVAIIPVAYRRGPALLLVPMHLTIVSSAAIRTDLMRLDVIR